MRRVDRGPWPLDDAENPKRFHPYGKAKADLSRRLGEYCSYCERPGDLHVEHVVPKRHRPDLEDEWSNFLLGCRNCNSIKKDRNTSRDGYIWPDRDDTQAAFEYFPDGIVKVRIDLPGSVRTKAAKLFDLVGLGRLPTNDQGAKDPRWRKRREVWRQAEIARRKFEEGADIDWVIMLARAVGFWSVWMTVFANDEILVGVALMERDEFDPFVLPELVETSLDVLPVEPPRVSRRLHSLSLQEDRADEFTGKILCGNAGAGRASGLSRPYATVNLFMKRRALEKMLRERGWKLLRHRGRHDIRTDGGLEEAVPRHTEINERLVRAVLRRAKKASAT